MSFLDTAFITQKVKVNYDSPLRNEILNTLNNDKDVLGKLQQSIQDRKPEKITTLAYHFIDTVKNSLTDLKKSESIENYNVSFFDDDEITQDADGNTVITFKEADVIKGSIDKEKMQDYVKSIAVSDQEIGNMDLLKINYVNFASEDKLHENLSVLKQISTKIEGLEKMNTLIDKVSLGYNITFDDYNVINDMNSLITKKLKTANYLNFQERKVLENFTGEFNKLAEFKKEADISLHKYNDDLNDVGKDVNVLVDELTKVEISLKKKGISLEFIQTLMEKREKAGISMEDINKFKNGTLSSTEVESLLKKAQSVGITKEQVSEIMKNYDEILMAGLLKKTLDNFMEITQNSKNKPSFGFSLYKVYMEKFTNFLANQEYKNNPQKLYQIMDEYSELVKKIEQTAISTENIESKKKTILELAQTYAGNNIKDIENFKFLLEQTNSFDINKGFSIMGDALNALSGKNDQNFSDSLGIIKGANNNDLDIARKAKSTTYDFIDKNISEKFRILSKSIEKVTESSNTHLKAKHKCILTCALLSNLMKNNPNFKSGMRKITDNEKQILISNAEKANFEQRLILKEIVNEYIKKANELQQEMLLTMDTKDANIVNLLESFRRIIVELDIDTRKLVKQELESQLIDMLFLTQLNANKDKLQFHDKMMSEINNIFKNSLEVLDAKMPFKMKQLKFSNNSAEFALLYLYRNMVA